jgi:hypothetical protein
MSPAQQQPDEQKRQASKHQAAHMHAMVTRSRWSRAHCCLLLTA